MCPFCAKETPLPPVRAGLCVQTSSTQGSQLAVSLVGRSWTSHPLQGGRHVLLLRRQNGDLPTAIDGRATSSTGGGEQESKPVLRA